MVFFILENYFISMIVMVCLSVVSTVFVISISSKKEAVPHWVQIIFLRHLARFTGLYREELDNYDCAESEKRERASKISFILERLEKTSNGTNVLSASIIDDIHFLRNNVEEKNADELIEEKWKVIGRVIDKCLLMIFSVFTVSISVALLTIASNRPTV